MTKSEKVWTGLPKVTVTVEHVDRALRALDGEIHNWVHDMVSMEGVMVAAAVIANMEEFDNRVGMPNLLIALTDEILGEYGSGWLSSNNGQPDSDEEERELLRERLRSERAEENAKRAAKAKATREAKVNARIAAAVAEATAKAA